MSSFGPTTASTSPFHVEPLESRTLLSALDLHINFQPAKTPPASGYIKDIGGTYRQRGSHTFGWNSPNPNAADRDHPRSRGHQEYDTFLALKAGKNRNAWEIALPYGLYSVHVVGGDPATPGSTIRIQAENVTVADGVTTKKRRWVEGTALVPVTDGRLTITGGRGAWQNVINFIDITLVRDAQQTLEAEDLDGQRGVSVGKSSVNSLDNTDWIRFDNVVFDDTIRSVQVRLAAATNQHDRYIEFRVGNPKTGRLIGTLRTRTTGNGDAFDVQYADITPISGTQTLYLVFKGAGSAGQVDWIRFSDDRLVRIMPLGDSITEGRGEGHDTYRHWLWHNLIDGGYSVNFVGSRIGVRPNSGDPWAYDYDWGHEGHSGYRTDEILANIDKWVRLARPEIVLLHLGTNDLMANQSPSSTVAEIGQIIDRLRAYNPAMTILLAQIIPCGLISDSVVRDFNTRLATLAQQKNSAQSRLLLVDQYTGFSVDADTYDGVHPTSAGEQKMAQKWYAALRSVLA